MAPPADGGFVIPDGGWGWVVVIGAFVQHVVTHGVFFSIGIMFTSLQEALDGSKVQIAWVVSIEIGSGFLSGPVTGFLISKYGTRIVSVIGSILGAGGYILSMYATNVYVLYVTMGLISGIGLGMIIIAAIVVVNEYFDAHRGLAAGISMAGTGCGAFLFNPLLNWLMEMYGWRGSLLVLSAIILNCIPAGLVYRPLKKRGTIFNERKSMVFKQSMQSIKSMHSADVPSKSNGLFHDLNVNYTSSLNPSLNGGLDGLKYDQYNSNERSIHLSLSDRLDSLTSDQNKNTTCTTTLEIQTSGISNSKGSIQDHVTSDNTVDDQYATLNTSYGDGMDLTYDDGQDEQLDSIDPLLTETHKSKAHGSVTICYGNDTKDTNFQKEQNKTGLLGQFALFKNAVFSLTVLAQFMLNFGFYVPFVYLPDKSKQEGLDETSTVWVLSTIGIASIFGRIVFGYIADRPHVNRLLLYTSGFLISGAVTSLCPLYNETWMMYSYAIIFGMFTGMVLGLTPVVLIDLLGLDILPAAFGISCLFRGFASLLGSPCAGFLVDLTGGYTISFIVAGMFMMCGALLMSIAMFIKRREVKFVTRDSRHDIRD